MRSKLEHAIEYESTTLEKHVTPIPTIVFDDIVSLSLHPQIEPDQGYSSEPPVGELFHGIQTQRDRGTLPRAFRTTGLLGHGSKQTRTCSTTGSHLNVRPVRPRVTEEVE